MKSFLLTSSALILCLLFFTQKSTASHTAGGSITYEYIGDSTGIPYNYCITLILYRREQGIGLGPTQTVSIESSCFGTQQVTVTQAQYNATHPGFVQGGTPRGDTNCIDQGDPGYGTAKIEEYGYRACVVLPGKCADFEFWWQQCCRNTNITNLATYPALYLESNLNNTLGPNTSPFFLNPGAKFFCVGQPFTWSQAAAEPDQDSMVFTLAQPWSADNTPIPWAPGYSTQQPMTTANGFNFNPATGVFQFTPTQAEVDVIKIVVEEYRFDTISFNWLLVGTAIREMQIPVLSTCNPIASTGVNITQGITTGGFTSKRINLNGDSLIAAFNVDSISDYASGSTEIDVIGYDCFDSIVKIKVNGDLKCSSISPDGTDFRLIGPDSIARPIVGIQNNCKSTLLTDEVDLFLHKPLDVNGDYLLQIKQGNDGNTIENECGYGVKEFFSIIIRVENCPKLKYNLQNVSVEYDQVIQLDWYVDPTSITAETDKLFSQWTILRSNADNPQFYPIAYLDGPGDVTRRSYIDTSLEMYNVDQSHYRYIVQLVQNFDYKPPTRNVRSILLQDTINSDSTGYNFEWTYYNGWQSPGYTIYKAQVDTSSPTLAWEAIGRGPDSNYFREEWLIPDPLNETNAGLYVFKVEAIDAMNTANNFISQSNWVYIDVPYNVPVPPLAPDSAVVPNVFSPNGDNINDIFYVSGVKGYTTASIEVFNRWGKRVFSASEDKDRAMTQALFWDGRDVNSGETLGDGVYYYVVNLGDHQTGISKNLKGQVNVIKN
jgi:gliding motility-associated-like protein